MPDRFLQLSDSHVLFAGSPGCATDVNSHTLAPVRASIPNTEPGGEFCGERHAERDRLAMEEPVGKSRRCLQRMGEGVAEVEERAVAGLALVAGNDRGLHPAARRDGMLARRAAGEHVLLVGIEPGEETGVAEQSIFDDFRIAGTKLPRRQGVEHCRVGHHQDRLVERSDQVLAMA